jgi:hypothetical protein
MDQPIRSRPQRPRLRLVAGGCTWIVYWNGKPVTGECGVDAAYRFAIRYARVWA